GMTPDLNDPRISGDFDYGVCRGTNPKCYHDWVDSRQDKVLLYTRTAGPRHANLGSNLGPGLNPPLNTGTNPNTVQTTLKAWLEAEGIVMDWTEDVNQRSEEHTSELQSRFDLVCRLLLEKKNNILQ